MAERRGCRGGREREEGRRRDESEGSDRGRTRGVGKIKGSRVLTGLDWRGKAGMMSVKGWVLMVGKCLWLWLEV